MLQIATLLRSRDSLSNLKFSKLSSQSRTQVSIPSFFQTWPYARVHVVSPLTALFTSSFSPFTLNKKRVALYRSTRQSFEVLKVLCNPAISIDPWFSVPASRQVWLFQLVYVLHL